MRFCPYAHRVNLVLEAKQIPYHATNINLIDKPEWYSEINSSGKVPALQLVNEPNAPFLVESLVIAEYLDEKYPENPLYPKDPFTKAEAKLWIERFAPVQSNFYQAATQPDKAEDALPALSNALDVWETELKTRATPYFNGNSIGILDYMIWPWIERLELAKVLHGDKFSYDEQRFPTLVNFNL